MSNETGDAPTDEQVERVARAMALVDDYDGCFERLDGTDPGGEEPMSTDAEDAEFWRKRARAALAAARVAPPVLSGERCWCFDVPADEHHSDCENAPSPVNERDHNGDFTTAMKRAYLAYKQPIQEDDVWAFGQGVKAGISAAFDVADATVAPAPSDGSEDYRIESVALALCKVFGFSPEHAKLPVWQERAENVLVALTAPASDATCGHPNHGNSDHNCAPFSSAKNQAAPSPAREKLRVEAFDALSRCSFASGADHATIHAALAAPAPVDEAKLAEVIAAAYESDAARLQGVNRHDERAAGAVREYLDSLRGDPSGTQPG